MSEEFDEFSELELSVVGFRQESFLENQVVYQWLKSDIKELMKVECRTCIEHKRILNRSKCMRIGCSENRLIISYSYSIIITDVILYQYGGKVSYLIDQDEFSGQEFSFFIDDMVVRMRDFKLNKLMNLVGSGLTDEEDLLIREMLYHLPGVDIDDIDDMDQRVMEYFRKQKDNGGESGDK